MPDRRVLLFSGGMDSTALAHLLDVDVLLYVASGSRYQEKELAALAGIWGLLPVPEMVIDDSLKLGGWEREDAIVPMRNLLYACVAARYGTRIAFGFTAGDRSRDKDMTFVHLASAVLTRLHEPQSWCAGDTITIEAPYKHASKAELVRAYLARGFDQQRLIDAVSCYDPHARQCGRCKACVRKFIAFAECGIDISGHDPAWAGVRDTTVYREIVSGTRGPEGASLR